jgi:chromosome segregation ATPase
LYISDLKIDEKIVSLNSNIELAKEMTNSIAQQKDKIDTIIKTIEVQETVIENIEKKNETQDTQISYANDLIVTMEKQIESYAFFAEEFNNIYMVARDFVKNFTKLEREMEHIYKRDNTLLAMIENIVAFIEKDYRKISNTIDHIDNLFETYAKEIISWTTESMMFVNEVKGYNLSLAAYNDKFDDISSMLDNVLNNISKIKEGK